MPPLAERAAAHVDRGGSYDVPQLVYREPHDLLAVDQTGVFPVMSPRR